MINLEKATIRFSAQELERLASLSNALALNTEITARMALTYAATEAATEDIPSTAAFQNALSEPEDISKLSFSLELGLLHRHRLGLIGATTEAAVGVYTRTGLALLADRLLTSSPRAPLGDRHARLRQWAKDIKYFDEDSGLIEGLISAFGLDEALKELNAYSVGVFPLPREFWRRGNFYIRSSKTLLYAYTPDVTIVFRDDQLPSDFYEYPWPSDREFAAMEFLGPKALNPHQQARYKWAKLQKLMAQNRSLIEQSVINALAEADYEDIRAESSISDRARAGLTAIKLLGQDNGYLEPNT